MANQPIQVIPGIPLIDSEEKDRALKPGQYGQGLNDQGELQVFEQGKGALSMQWGVPEEFLNTVIAGGGVEAIARIGDWISNITPWGDDVSLPERRADLRSDQQLWREANPIQAGAVQAVSSIFPTKFVKAIGAFLRGAPIAGKAVGAIPRYLDAVLKSFR
jgi:hypothetical protein